MKALVIALSVVLVLPGCSRLKQAYESVSTTKVPPKLILVAANSFNAAKATATNYIRYCTPNPAPAGCNDNVIRGTLIPNMKAGTVARDKLEAFMDDHPGELGPRGTYDALVASTDIINAIVKANR